MTKQEQENYLDKWSTGCMLCDADVDRKDMHLIKSIVPLTVFPDHADPQIIRYYMACPECVEAEELV